MSEKMMKKSRTLIVGLLGTAMIAALTLWGCGSSGTKGYDDPTASITTTKTATALIEPVTLKQWIDEGKVNNTDPASRDRVVVVTVSPSASYTTAHIPGAQLMDAGALSMTRLEGVGTIQFMVLDGNSMDALIQKMCINKNTTVVFTVSKGVNLYLATRAYFTFRYWGVPKERLKILNGGDDAWNDAAAASGWSTAYSLTAAVPAVTASTFSVRNLNSGNTANFNNRYSIGQMLNLVDKINAGAIKTDATGVTILDERGGITPVTVSNAVIDDGFGYVTAPAPGKTSLINSTTALTTRLASFGVTPSKSMTYVYCFSGYKASIPFFVLDGILGLPVTLYDGSWFQWSSYASGATINKVAVAWQTDIIPASGPGRSTGVIPPETKFMISDPISNALYTTVTDPRANQILNDDNAYFIGGTKTIAPAPATGGSGAPAGGC